MDAQNTDQVEPQPHAAMEVRKHFSQNALAKRSVGSANGIQLTKHAIAWTGTELLFLGWHDTKCGLHSTGSF